MFAILVYDPDQLRWNSLPGAVLAWVRDAGLFAALALAIWGLAYLIQLIVHQRPASTARSGSAPTILFILSLAASGMMYLLFFLLLFVQGTTAVLEKAANGKELSVTHFTPQQEFCRTAGGGFALLAVFIPILFALGRLRLRRIWAIARLSIKETIRQRVLWVFSLLILVILFASWFIDSDKPEFQLRNYVWVVDWSMTILLLVAASLLAAFSIPSDVRSQTIHTVVTKPVERFEIVLGRFLGYTLLMTLVLGVVTILGLVYVFRNINEEAKRENYKARVPIYGNLDYKGTEGESVGREFTHRKYISGPRRGQPQETHFAIWSFPELPGRLAERPDGVSCEFAFDVYRTHKGEEGKGVFCTFRFATERCKLTSRMEPEDSAKIKELEKKLVQEGKSRFEIKDQVAEKFGYFEEPSQAIKDYHTQEIILPQGLFKNATDQEGAAEEGMGDEGNLHGGALRVIVNVTAQSRSQLVGVAKQDLYLLDDERTFEENFFKSAFGLWSRLCLVIGLAVTCSTYLSGIISWMCTMFIFCLGLFKSDIQQLALGINDGGGPIEAMLKLANRQPIAAQLEMTPSAKVALLFDEGYRWVMGQLLKLIPDVNRFDLSRYVSNGFDIGLSNVLLLDDLLRLLGFLVPCLVLAFYLIKYREIANPT